MGKSLVFQTDFGTSDGAVSAMKGVAISVDSKLNLFDLTHDIPPYNIWEGSYRLYQTISYWPEGTVFVSVVDPGVGSDRKSIVVKTYDNRFIVTPDNGTITHIKQNIGIREAREIDETVNRLPNSSNSYTFYGRDVYAYTGARLAAGVISFKEVGPALNVEELIILPVLEPVLTEEVLSGSIDILDIRFGNLWTNVDRQLFEDAGIAYGESVEVSISNNERLVYKNIMIFGRCFSDTHIGEPILYVNSLDKIGVAINQGSFAKAYHISTGVNWKIMIHKVHKGSFY
ncbi:S-adenosyl-l-methionine hydroxide adenosyltransferase family protein [Bacillus sp. FJAT-49736]|uniref:SAM hydrolase/SAM-dependent halogenase family protein n=1 Tax=Bacillus sp. FJAT-49736 TaxID=2833582 RepID=UPI001BC91D6E|nr:S-adenosyl-l-methionine hydroxide adenosyltransferase family protein [Bacillus sp. FJAT-49736]MBS4174729.1 S-adenosyl-l-methionine hydroxide adenosyltransferase family protein [Bacillus sp. FJAT-49736]